MKISKRLLVGIAAAATVGAASAMEYNLRGYVGIGAKAINSKIADRDGGWGKLLPQGAFGPQIFVGTKFHENFGVELGYFRTKARHRNATLASDYSIFGVLLGPAGVYSTPLGLRSTVKYSQINLDLNGYYPVTDSFQAVGTLGMGWSKAKVQIEKRYVDGHARFFGDNIVKVEGSKRRFTPRIGLGGEFKVCDCVAVTARGLWEGLGRLRVRNQEQAGRDIPAKAWKNSFGVDASVKWYFM